MTATLLIVAGISAALALPSLAQVPALSEFSWKNRVLLGHPENREVLDQLTEQLDALSEELNERKIQVVLNWRNQLRFIPETKIKLSHTDLIRLLVEHEGNYLLVGLDGSIKTQYLPNEFDLEKVFEDIDLMPMRQAELNTASEDLP